MSDLDRMMRELVIANRILANEDVVDASIFRNSSGNDPDVVPCLPIPCSHGNVGGHGDGDEPQDPDDDDHDDRLYPVKPERSGDAL